ncbi:MAG TPA: hypothetical protein VNA57_09865 [Acidimicrobiales bacterium]|nr:hypothetical protein [Acidimicrobiales bacterium]
MAKRSEQHSLVGVYESEAEAQKVARRAREAGASESDVRLGAREDEVVSLQAEMQEEMDQSWVSPQAGFAYSKESAKGLAMLMPLLALAGAVLALPLGLIPFGDIALWVRLVVAAFIGSVAGATIALIAGPSLGSTSPHRAMGAHRGTVVRVDGGSPEIARTMADAEPVRLDEISSDDSRVATVTTEEQRSDEGGVEQVARNLNADDR